MRYSLFERNKVNMTKLTEIKQCNIYIYINLQIVIYIKLLNIYSLDPLLIYTIYYNRLDDVGNFPSILKVVTYNIQSYKKNVQLSLSENLNHRFSH